MRARHDRNGAHGSAATLLQLTCMQNYGIRLLRSASFGTATNDRGLKHFSVTPCGFVSAAEFSMTRRRGRRARGFRFTFAHQRLSVAVHKAVAREVSDALAGHSAAVDPRGAPRE